MDQEIANLAGSSFQTNVPVIEKLALALPKKVAC